VWRQPFRQRRMTRGGAHSRAAACTRSILHFEPSLDALSLRSDVISSIKILSQVDFFEVDFFSSPLLSLQVLEGP